MITWIDVMAAQARAKDMRREAERKRLVRQALAAREKRGPFYGPALSWVGRRLVAWGAGAGRISPSVQDVETPSFTIS